MAIDTTIFDLMRFGRGSFYLSEPVETNRLGNGDVLTASLGAALWSGEYTVLPVRHSKAAEIEARLSVLQRPGEFFTAYDRRFCGPSLDHGGAALAGSSPKINTLDTDNKSLSVDGLPAGYEIRPGDYLGWEYGASPVRKALHRVVTGAVADGTGRTPLMQVAPHIRAGGAVGADVNLVRPSIKARLLDVTYGRGGGGVTEGAQITFIQTLR